jgi:hypothetical protein
MASKQTATKTAPAAPQTVAPAGQPNTAVTAHTPGGALATAEDIANLGSFDGFDSISKDDVSIPFLVVLQPLSPQVQPGQPSYIEGAKAGQILQTVTGEVFDHVMVVPCDYKRSFIEWVPRNKGGGFRGEHGLEAEKTFNEKINRETGKAKLENENDLVDTRSFFVLTSAMTEEGTQTVSPAMVAMASTQVKVAKNWMNLILNYVPPGQKPGGRFPPWAAIYKLSTAMQKNEKGIWYVFKVERVGFNRVPELQTAAQQFHAQIRQGIIKVDRSAMDAAGGEESPQGARADTGKGAF